MRTREWLYDKSLWDDELSITSNIVSRGYRGLIKPLALEQGAPVGWLWAERTSVNVFGVHELALRLPAFAGSVIALAVFPMLARRLIGAWATPVATFLIATSPALVYYAAETKQYSTDAAAAVLLLAATTELWHRTAAVPDHPGPVVEGQVDSAHAARPEENAPGSIRGSGPAAWWRGTLRPAGWWGAAWGVVAATLTWSSQPALLVAAASGLVLLCGCRHNGVRRGAVLVGGVILVLSIVAEWEVNLKNLSKDQVLGLYWQNAQAYPPRSAGPGSTMTWAARSADRIVGNLGHLTPAVVGVVLAVAGLIALAVGRRFAAALFAVILCAAFGAAMTRHFPLVGPTQQLSRLSLYLVPVVMLLLAAAVEVGLLARRLVVARGVHGAGAVAGVAIAGLAGLLVIGLTAEDGWLAGMHKFAVPDETTAGRQAIAFVAGHRQPGDVVVLGQHANAAFNFYGPRFAVRAAGRAQLKRAGAQPCAPHPFKALNIDGSRRVWLILANHASSEPANRNQLYLQALTAYGPLLDSYQGGGDAAAYLFGIDTSATTNQPPSGIYCLSVTRG